MKQVRLRPLAETDLVEQTRYYAGAGGEELGGRFFDTAITTLDIVGDHPEGGSLRIGELCEIESLRVRPVKGFPCGWFYFVRDDHIDVVRPLGYAQGLPAELSELG